MMKKRFWGNIYINISLQDKKNNLYVYDIPLPVHTKFIENNSVLIKSLTKKNEMKFDFEETFGLKGKSALVHFRSLSKNIPMLFSKTAVSECVLRVEDFSSLDEEFLSKFKNVFIVENEMVYLTFPETPESICVWGQGYKVNVLGSVSWLETKNLFYFGDLDEHGFDILSTYRRFFPDVKSFCMTEKVLDDYELFMVEGKKLDGGRILENLSNNEKNVFMRIRGSEKNRLEQERISVNYIIQELSKT